LPRRHLHAFALGGGVRHELAPPPDADRDLRRALALPSDGNLRLLARRLARAAPRDEGALEAIEIQVWGVRYGEGLAPSGALLRGVRFEPDEWEES
jgi:hypothetical protein